MARIWKEETPIKRFLSWENRFGMVTTSCCRKTIAPMNGVDFYVQMRQRLITSGDERAYAGYTASAQLHCERCRIGHFETECKS